MKAFITSQFSYCQLVWMFHSTTVNNRINTLHQKALRPAYTNKPNQKNWQILATEIYKVKNDLGPKTVADIFHFLEIPYNLRNDSIIQRLANRTDYFGTKSISSPPSKLLELIPSEIKSAKSQNILKEKKILYNR